MLTLDNLTLQRGDFTITAAIEIDAGAKVALMGPSGAGKTTLLSAIAGFLHPTTGRILWNDTDLTPMPPAKRPLSILFQDQNLFPHLTVHQNIGLGLDPRLRLDRADMARIDAVLERIDLAEMGARKPAALSGGQQSRVALARALLRARPLLLLDEPFGALGPALKSEMLALVGEMAHEQRTTVLMVSHDPDDASALCPQTVVITGGRATPPQPTHELLRAPPPDLAAYLGPSKT